MKLFMDGVEVVVYVFTLLDCIATNSKWKGFGGKWSWSDQDNILALA
jgi:hypothetical protein